MKKKFLSWLLVFSVIVSLFSPGLTRAHAEDGAPKGYVTLSVEKFTLGQGYYREPVKVPFYEGENGAALITRVIGEENMNAKYYGDQFYLSKIKDSDSQTHIPQYIVDAVANDGQTIGERNDPNWLGEFDYTSMSGWMYALNNQFPGYGFSAYEPQDGDVVRAQFSVYGYGADLGAEGYGFIQAANKDALTAKVAAINSDPDRAAYLADSAIHTAYVHAYDVLENLESTQSSVDDALGDLAEETSRDIFKPVLTITGLSDGLEVYSSQLVFKVGVKDNVDAVVLPEVKVNGTVVFAASGGQYQANLNAGTNVITVSATDAAGNRAEKSLNVIYVNRTALNAKSQLEKNLPYIVKTVTNPKFGTLGGEWSVLSLARASYAVPDGYYNKYFSNVVSSVAALKDANGGVLDKNKSTEHSRLILALSAIGKDAHDVGKYDVTEALSDLDYVAKQGNNGPIFALIAMDTVNYDFAPAKSDKTQATREKLIDYILDNEVKKGAPDAGGWALGVTKADVDMTGMALQALAPYYRTNDKVKAAADRAIQWLSANQNATGGYTSFGSTSSESLSQVVTALSELGIDSTSDPRFIKNGISAMDALLAFAVTDGGFKHVSTGKVDSMATDQGTYALVAYDRMARGANRLYEMTDVVPMQSGSANETVVTLPGGVHHDLTIPSDYIDYSLSISPVDAYKDVTILIPESKISSVRLNLTPNVSLPGISATKGQVSAAIPKGAKVVSGDPSSLEWLSTIDIANPAMATSIGSIIAQGKKLDAISAAIRMGGTADIAFDSFVTLTFTGQKGKQAAFIQNGTAQAIEKFANDADGLASGKAEYAYDYGNDLVVKTKHFTDFVAYADKTDGASGGGGATAHATLSIDKLTIGRGYVISPKSVALQPGDTVWSVLQREMDANGIIYSVKWYSEYNSVYVQSIAGDGEFNHGEGSGWMYNVNGTYPNYGADLYTLKNGDSVQWRYTTDLGCDLGAGQEGCVPGSGAPALDPNDKTPIIAVPNDNKSDYILSLTEKMKSTENITLNIPEEKKKVVLNLKEVSDGIPKVTANKGTLSFVIDKGTKLKSGPTSIEVLTSIDVKDAKLQQSIQDTIGSKVRLNRIVNAFVMGSSNQSVVFDRPVSLTVKGGKGQLAGFVENDNFIPIAVYDSETQGAQAVQGMEKYAYAYVAGKDLVIRTNHFTSFVTYTAEAAASPEPKADPKDRYADAALISSWAYGAIGDATSKGFLQGSGGKLNPKGSVTRAEFAKLLVSVLGLSTEGGSANAFSDVPSGKWFAPYVNAAYGAGWIAGYDKQFKPNDTITREQMAVILNKALGNPQTSDISAINDLDKVSSWAKADVKKIVSLALMTGQNNRFDPKSAVSREMATVVSMRAYAYKGGADAGGQPEADTKLSVSKQIAETAAYMQRTITNPTVSSIGGEWTVFGLARSGSNVPVAYNALYYANLEKTLKEKDGNLHSVKYTEYSRVILALGAIGRKVDDVAGYNLLERLSDFDTLIKQGINGPIFALIALDSKKYEIPKDAGVKTQTTRDLLIDFILKREVQGGGWALGEKPVASDPDITGMAIQSLAPYYASNKDVRDAVDRALAWLSKAQTADGGYASYNSVNSESIAQVIVAITSLGIDPNTDPRFVKNGHSALAALLGFAAKDGGFYHIKAGGIDNGGAKPGNVDPMATDQAMYALVAYERYANAKTRLYDMTDVK
ncbi:DUF4430 domain-containing protein [Cohnella endophytica]|uniref:DUF4430 domain-containing protein n=1 Tax=Cohnella endophytica TaxID=2419778 RepID=A0A494Y707_9BACL|nr:DUF4430 domain-containing protein [Cohnella endophytica]RKP58084.1 DUF4430 domain-containing protein [Cohnella endophytica]